LYCGRGIEATPWYAALIIIYGIEPKGIRCKIVTLHTATVTISAVARMITAHSEHTHRTKNSAQRTREQDSRTAIQGDTNSTTSGMLVPDSLVPKLHIWSKNMESNPVVKQA
jgi:hypothetical protein